MIIKIIMIIIRIIILLLIIIVIIIMGFNLVAFKGTFTTTDDEA